MMKYYFCFLLLIFFCIKLPAQYLQKKIINTTGSNYTGNSFSIKASVGEPIVGMISADSTTRLSQGFLAGIKIYPADSVYSGYSFSLYPNPTMSYIVIEGDLTLIKQVDLFDIYGDLVSIQYIQNGTVQISDLERGFYIVQLIGKSNETLGQFKIIKL